MSETILISGGCGFVGHHFVEHFLKNTDWNIVIFDRLSYASSGLDRVRDINAFDDDRVSFYSVDLTKEISEGIIKELKDDINYIIHLAAESHVDRSIEDPLTFIKSNMIGTHNLLWFSRYLDNLKAFCYFSTDEVFGPAGENQYFKEWDRYNCTNPYSATKAGAEELCLAYANTYHLPIFTTHTMNCFTGDTKIQLLDSRKEEKIENLVGEEFWVYSYDIKNDNIVPGKAHSCKLTRENVPIYEIKLDNDEIIKCTGDHLFLLRSGEYKEAKELNANDSLMPLYKRRSKRDREEIFYPEQNEWKKTHDMSYEWKYGSREKGMVAHHLDFDKENNIPKNILAMEIKAHIKYHSCHAKKLNDKLTKEGKHPFQNLTQDQLNRRGQTKKEKGDYDKVAEKLVEWQKDEDNKQYRDRKHKEKIDENPEKYKNIALENLKKANTREVKLKIAETKRKNDYWDIKSEEMKENNPMHNDEVKDKMVKIRKENGTYEEHGEWLKKLAQEGNHPNQKEEVRNKMSQSQKTSEKAKVGRYKTAKKKKENTAINYGFDGHEESVNIIGNLYFNEKMTFKEIKEKFNASHGFVQNRIKEYKQNYLNKNNHKVKSVRFIGYDNVYDFTVDKYHNFALSAGIFVHNCFGERQHPEKFIPMCIRKILNDETIYIHSDETKAISGTRHWIHARNVVQGIHFLLDKFTFRDKYNIVGNEISNYELAEFIGVILGKEPKLEMIDFHSSRPGHDLKYSLDGTKMKELGWEPPLSTLESLENTIIWTLKNREWLYK